MDRAPARPLPMITREAGTGLDPGPFLDALFAALETHHIDVSGSYLDHLCYRVADTEGFEAMRTRLATTGALLGETRVQGRPIATYRLHVPMVHHHRRIEVIELPAPKPGSPYPEGFEHAEFVVDEDLSALTRRYPHLPWDLSGLAKTVNADVRLRFGPIAVKFHRHSLAEVIAAEREGRQRTTL